MFLPSAFAMVKVSPLSKVESWLCMNEQDDDLVCVCARNGIPGAIDCKVHAFYITILHEIHRNGPPGHTVLNGVGIVHSVCVWRRAGSQNRGRIEN